MPPLFSPSFGLIQEELSHDPFRLLIAVTFLIKVSAKVALPIFGRFIERFPTPESLASEDVKSEIQDFIKPLGLAKNRRRIIQKYARGWLSNPPTREKRYVVRSYMYAGAATAEQIRDGEEFGPESAEENEQDARKRTTGLAWEIGHLTKGSYALDSWRIFCRDELLGRSKHWKGNPSQDGFQPEWMRVLPGDKELRACLRWMWMREGWEWDPATGEKEPLRDEMRKAVNVGRVGYDESGGLVILDNN
ncbi:hypothetical protein QBC38DRAFT_505951 [Podospora fimiseda]|uniref:HhH-GPD domain-containing protein n=1 Tax=Podospora fimiseda TaxID=252190 RepID=A0AAN7BZ92_9PEZI|nr:hypothetical protein QBC38DRAFT_505951 [Podospora fimiseda]